MCTTRARRLMQELPPDDAATGAVLRKCAVCFVVVMLAAASFDSPDADRSVAGGPAVHETAIPAATPVETRQPRVDASAQQHAFQRALGQDIEALTQER